MGMESNDWVAPDDGSPGLLEPDSSIDFARSFSFWTIDLQKKKATTMSDIPPFDKNTPRIPIDCVMTVEDKASGAREVLHLCGNCKTETVGVKSGVWMRPNADFVPIYTDTKFNIVKTYDRVGRAVKFSSFSADAGTVQPSRQSGLNAEAYSELRNAPFRITARALATAAEVVERGLKTAEPLMARTEFENARYRCALEYPFRTCNFNDRAGVFQPDTGPVLFPDLSAPSVEDMIDRAELAFIAWNAYPGSPTGSDGWAEFLVREPSQVAPGVSVMHYNKSCHVKCRNTVFTTLT